MSRFSDHQLIGLIEDYMHGSNNPDLIGYREQTLTRDFADKVRFIWFIKHIAKLGNYRGKRILDVGCGFGWYAFAVSLLDEGNDVVGMDILPSMIDGMRDCVRSMQSRGMTFRLAPVCADICNADFQPNSFDAIYSNEAIEHVHNMEAMIERCYSFLRPGGNLILVNDQNVINRKGHADTVAMWNKRENSWEWCDYLRRIRPIEHGNARPFSVMRREIITAARPDLHSEMVELLVEATAGMLKPDIERVAREYRVMGSPLPKRPELDWCRNPETGEYAERLFNPFELADMMRHRGFVRTRVRHLFRKFPLNLLNPIQFKPLNMALFNVRPLFVVYGERS